MEDSEPVAQENGSKSDHESHHDDESNSGPYDEDALDESLYNVKVEIEEEGIDHFINFQSVGRPCPAAIKNAVLRGTMPARKGEILFDTEQFIEEIKQRPCLWNCGVNDYNNKAMRKAKWAEVAMLFGASGKTEARQNAIRESLQKKWRNLKDSFTREKRRIERAEGPEKRTEYVFYQAMSFLHTASRPSVTRDSFRRLIHDEDPDDQPTDGEPGAFFPKKRKTPTEEVSLVEALREALNSNQVLERDEDRLFIMSLLKDFKKIPRSLKFSAKRQLLNVIEQHQPDFSGQPSFLQELNEPVVPVPSKKGGRPRKKKRIPGKISIEVEEDDIL